MIATLQELGCTNQESDRVLLTVDTDLDEKVATIMEVHYTKLLPWPALQCDD
jgi:hypothetical protein